MTSQQDEDVRWLMENRYPIGDIKDYQRQADADPDFTLHDFFSDSRFKSKKYGTWGKNGRFDPHIKDDE